MSTTDKFFGDVLSEVDGPSLGRRNSYLFSGKGTLGQNSMTVIIGYLGVGPKLKFSDEVKCHWIPNQVRRDP